MPMVPQMGEPGFFWRGADGKVYVKGSAGTNVAGNWDSNTSKYWGDRMYQEIPDPVNNQQSGPVGSNAPTGGGGGGGGAAAPVLNRVGIDNTQRTIDQLPGLLEAALGAERNRYSNTINEFNTQEQGQRKTYDTSTTTNQLNYDSNFMDSIRAGIKGLGGLMSMLRGTGAGGGTAEDMARDTVGEVTSKDIRTGADTQKENQGQLDSSLESFLGELGRKRRVNEDTLVNNERAIRRDNDTQLSELFGKMAGFYGDVGDQGNSNAWMSRAGELTPRIAANSRTQVSPYDTTPIAIKAPELTAFSGPSQPDVAVAPENGQVGSGIFTITDPRRRREPTVAVPVGV